MKRLKFIIGFFCAFIMVCWAIKIFAYEGPPTEEGAKWRQEQANIKEAIKEASQEEEDWRAYQLWLHENATYQRRKIRNKLDSLDTPQTFLIKTVDKDLQKVVDYLIMNNERNTRRISDLEETIKKLEKKVALNYKLEKAHWNKVIEIKNDVKQLVKARLRHQHNESK